MRRPNRFTMLGAALVVFASVSGAQRAAEIEIGDILGAEYADSTGRFLLYAAEPSAGQGSRLSADDVLRMALAVVRYGNFAFSLESGRENAEIRYLHPDKGGEVTRILSGSPIEATFALTDSVLKALVHGDRSAAGIAAGASGLALCSEQLCGAAGDMVPDLTTVYVTYFELDVDYVFEHALRIWFRQPKLRVKADTRRKEFPAPACLQRFADSLSKNGPLLMAHPKLGGEFRRLRMLLLLAHAIGRAKGMYVPIEPAWLETQTAAASRAPFRLPLKAYRIACRDPNRPDLVRSFSIHGGIAVPGVGSGASEASPDSTRRPLSGPPRLGARLVTVNSGRMLEIDLSGCLGLERELIP